MNREKFTEYMLDVIKEATADETCSIAISGSVGKNVFDKNSDFDFRLYIVRDIPPKELRNFNTIVMEKAKPVYEKYGYVVDGIWPRLVSFIDSELDKWLSGKGQVIDTKWTVYGYHILTDIFNQKILYDPLKTAENWHNRLDPYPAPLAEYIISYHGEILKYWQNDYHFKHKVMLCDFVFLSSLFSKLIHHILEIIYAKNRFYYPGDGHNIKFLDSFKLKPSNLKERIKNILYPSSLDFSEAYEDILLLIKETLAL